MLSIETGNRNNINKNNNSCTIGNKMKDDYKLTY